jgi:hypothetical protein
MFDDGNFASNVGFRPLLGAFMGSIIVNNYESREELEHCKPCSGRSHYFFFISGHVD